MNEQKVQAITVCAFIYHNNRLLIAKRAKAKTFLPDKYELLGGHVDFGESLQDCLVRELKEELQIDIVVEELYYAFTYVSNHNTKHSVEVDFLSYMKNHQQQIQINPKDHSEYHWIVEEEIDKYFAKDDAERVAVKKGFEKLEHLL